MSDPAIERVTVHAWDKHVLDSFLYGARSGRVFVGSTNRSRPNVGDRVRPIPELGGAVVTVKNVDPSGEALSVLLPSGTVVALGRAALRWPMESGGEPFAAERLA
jgi:hypothetical protein